MYTLIRAAALALALQQAATVTAELAGQGNGTADRPPNPACALVTEKEVEAATGLDYGPGKDFDELYQGPGGKAICLWGGPSMVREDLPEISVVLVPASARGSHTEARRKGALLPGCSREPVRGVGDDAFAEVCQRSIPSVHVYARTGNTDVVVGVDQLRGMSMGSAKPAAIALAKAAAARVAAK